MIEIVKNNDGGLDKVTGKRCSISAHRLDNKQWSVVITDEAMNTLSLEIDGYLSVNYSQKRDAEHRNGAEQPQQTCPSCKGTGVRRYTMWARRRTCSRCRGTGQV